MKVRKNGVVEATSSQPVSGTITADIGDSGELALEATLQSVRDEIGAIAANPTANTVQDRLKGIKTTLDTLLTQADFDSHLGEVQASPTANTVLARLKDIKTSIDSASSGSDNTTTNALLTSIRDYVDTVETKLQSLIDKDFATETTQAVIAAIVQTALDVPLSSLNAEATQQTVLARLDDIKTAVQAIKIDADSIAIDADTINLNTDDLENIISQVRDRLPGTLGQKVSDASLAVVLSTQQEAILADIVARLLEIKGQQTDGTQKTVDVTVPVYKTGTATAAGVFVAAFEVGVGGYFTLSAVTTGAWQDTAGQAGLVAVEGTNDPTGTTGWGAIRMENANGQTTTAMRGGGTYGTIVTTRWLRVNCLVFKAGTFAANLVVFSKPRQMFRQNIKDQDGIASWEMTPGTGRGHVVSPTPLLGGSFDIAIDLDAWTVTATGTGTATLVAGNGVKLATGTTANSTVRIQSNRVADIVPGMSNLVDIIAATEHAGNVGCVKRWGIFDDDSGTFFEQYHDGTTGQIRVVTRKAGVDTTILLNGTNNIGNNGFGVPLFNLYELQVDPLFVKAKQSGILVALGSGLFPSLLSKYNLPLRFEIINSGGAVTNNTLYVQNAGVLRLGPPQTIRADQVFQDDDVLSATGAVIQGRRFTGGFDQVPLAEHARDIGNEQVSPLTNGTPVTFTADNTTDLIHAVAHGLAADQPIWLTTTGLLPQGLATNQLYYVSAPVTVDDFKISTTRSTALGHTTVNFTDDGTGTLSFKTAGEFTGTYTRISDFDHSEFLYASLGLFTAERIWSDDGVNEQTGGFGRSVLAQKTQGGYNLSYDVTEGRNMGPFYKIHIINGPNNQSAFPGFICINWLFKTPYQGAFSFVDDEPSNLTKALTVKQFHQKTTRLTSTPLTGIQTFTADASANTINKVAHGLVLGQTIQLTTTGTLPAPLTTGVRYFVRDVLVDSFKVAATMSVGIPGSVIDLTDVGTGVHSYEPTFTTRGLAAVNGQTPNAQGYFAGTNWADIDLHLFGSPADATGTLYFYFSHDGITDHIGPVPHFIRDLTQMIPIPLRNYAFWRVSYKNDLIPQTVFGLFVTQRASVASDMTRFPSQDIYADEPVKSSQSIIMGAPPDYNDAPNTTAFRRIRVSGTHTLGSLATSLPGNTGGTDHIGVGKWFHGLGDFAMGATDIEADVDGQWRIEFSNVANPVDYTDDDVEDFTDYENYTPSLGIDKSAFAFLTRWARIKYINGSAAQTFISVDVSYFVQPIASGLKIARRPIKGRSVVSMTDAITTSRTDESTVESPVYLQDTSTLNTDTNRRGKNAHITGIDVPVIIRPPVSGPQTNQFILTQSAQRIDTPDIGGYRYVEVRNAGAYHAFIKEDDTISETNSQPIFLGGNALYGLAPGKELWGICENVGGTSQATNKDGTVSGGTGSSQSNVLVDDASYALQTAVAQTLYAEGFSFSFGGGFTAISRLRIGYKARKQSGQFEQVVQVEAREGVTTGAGSVTTSATFAAAQDALLLASISRVTTSATVTTVTGCGLTWLPVPGEINITNGGRRIDLWYAFGDNTATTVTANLSASDRAAISVIRYANADPTGPIQAHSSATGASATPTGPTLASTNKGISFYAVCHDSNSATPGASYTEHADINNGALDMAVESKQITATGTETATMTIASSSSWASIAVTIAPKPAITPAITASYLYNGASRPITSSFSYSSTSDANQYLDVTPDFVSIVPADIALIRGISTLSTIGAARLETNQIFLEVTETSDAQTRISVLQTGEGA